MEVFDNVLGNKSLGILQNEIIHNKLFPWHFSVTTETKLSYSVFDYSFVHMILLDGEIMSPYYNIIFPVLTGAFEKLDISYKKFLRFRLALQTSIGRKHVNDIHIDSIEPHRSAIFYLNNSDGSTILYENLYDPSSQLSAKDYKQKIQLENFHAAYEIEPMENRLLIFDGYRYHSSQRPIKHPSRIILNINFV